MLNSIHSPHNDGYVDMRTDAEIDEAYRRANEENDPSIQPVPEWWNSPYMTIAILLGLIAIIGFGLWGMFH